MHAFLKNYPSTTKFYRMHKILSAGREVDRDVYYIKYIFVI